MSMESRILHGDSLLKGDALHVFFQSTWSKSSSRAAGSELCIDLRGAPNAGSRNEKESVLLVFRVE